MRDEIVVTAISSFLAVAGGLVLIAVQRSVDRRRESDREGREEIDRAKTAILFPLYRILTHWGEGTFAILDGNDPANVVVVRELLVSPHRVYAYRHFPDVLRAAEAFLESAEVLAGWVNDVARNGGKLHVLGRSDERGQDWTRSDYNTVLQFHAGIRSDYPTVSDEIRNLGEQTAALKQVSDRLRGAAVERLKLALLETPER